MSFSLSLPHTSATTFEMCVVSLEISNLMLHCIERCIVAKFLSQAKNLQLITDQGIAFYQTQYNAQKINKNLLPNAFTPI
jgi:hypothetical protein